MAITWAGNVAVIAPELATAPVALQTLILAVVDRQVDGDAWGDFVDDGKMYLAAHLGTISTGGAAAGVGAITSESLGAMSRSYGLPATVEGELATTKYGLMYKHLLKVALCPAALVP